MGEKGDNALPGPLIDVLCLAHPFPIDTLKPIYLCSYIKTIFSFAQSSKVSHYGTL